LFCPTRSKTSGSTAHAKRSRPHGSWPRWLSRPPKRRRAWYQISLARNPTSRWHCRNLEIHGTQLCSTSALTPRVQ